ncbi:MAG TPA: M1 family metallopeptidase [Saprospiraceae bacterium]|nr:M1 family metallopeptidase [Saprospiraceae bacterium]HMQ84916.1 M1 family metallopeptidase [Saprospiraceae bacterium]
MNRIFLFIGLLLSSFACQSEHKTDSNSALAATFVDDPHSFSRPNEAYTTHLDLNIRVDFEQKMLQGYARYQIVHQQADKIVLDTRNLSIEKVTLHEGAAEQETTFQLAAPVDHLGSALSIDLSPDTKVITVYYQTQPDGADALDWLDPEQTSDKKTPFLFTQGQAVLTRTWIPCQDSPGIRITYDATVQTPPNMMAVMSAGGNPQQKNEQGIYQFHMKHPIPPYLLALSVGDLAFRSLGERSGVYAEPGVIEAAAYEFADTEKMLEATEALYGTYLWGRYDLIVLPPSFPFGGMENPCLTFATPTIIAGDRSLTALVAHELAHSWSGNLVTNATWNDFWLNEGFTVYLERRIMEALYGKSYADMLAILGYQDLLEDATDLGMDSEDTQLKLNLAGRDPDEGSTDIAYEKGAFFLTLLESKVGRDRFDEFVKGYFKTHQFQSLTTEDFVAYLKSHLLEKYQVDVNWEAWIYQPGIPDNIPIPVSDRFDAVATQVKALEQGAPTADLKTEGWSSHEWLHFIRHLPVDFSTKQMGALDQQFGFAQSGNSEIQAAWYQLAIKNGYWPAIEGQIEAFLIKVGRRKFLTPLYGSFKAADQLEAARSIYKKARPNYHSVSRKTIDELLEWKE